MKVKTPIQVEQEFDDIIDIRLKARGTNDYKTLADTEDQWKETLKEYLEMVHNKHADAKTEYTEPLSDYDKEKVKRTINKLNFNK